MQLLRVKEQLREADAESYLHMMLEADKALYERILDTPGLAFAFNQLVRMAENK